jgi:enhancing lycopene biosynthesis protein 2
MTKKVAVVLSGCGFLDGSEIHETVVTLLHLYKNGAEPVCFAPNMNQRRVMNHLTKERSSETRNVLVEAARIARSEVSGLDKLKAADFDAVIFPGGYGAALNLCDFGVKGPDCTLEPAVENVLKDFHAAKRPIGLICIAPALGAKAFGSKGVELTIGSDPGTAGALEKLGAKHVNKRADEIHVDEINLVVSTPAYMLAKNIFEVEQGVAKLVVQVLKMA